MFLGGSSMTLLSKTTPGDTGVKQRSLTTTLAMSSPEFSWLSEYTVSWALLDTDPYSFLARHKNVPPSSGRASAITRVQISSGSEADRGFF